MRSTWLMAHGLLGGLSCVSFAAIGKRDFVSDGKPAPRNLVLRDDRRHPAIHHAFLQPWYPRGRRLQSL